MLRGTLLVAMLALASCSQTAAVGRDAGSIAPPDAGAGGSAGGGGGAGGGGEGGAPVEPDAATPTDGAPPTDATGTRDAGAPERAGWTLVWADEFDVDGPPNAADWRFESGFQRNEELQWYQPDNATVAGGMLLIEARREQRANPNYQAGSGDWKRSRATIEYTSTSMTTSGRHSFTYGRFEIRARIDTRAGSWPAFWMLGSGAWPRSGEVDIMEYYRNTVLANVCKPVTGDCDWASVTRSLSSLGGSAWTSQFHVWAMEWDQETIDLFLDDVLTNHFVVADAVPAGQQNPYVDRPFYMLVNLAVGGTNGGDPANTAFPLRYEVDYVRVYQRAP